MIIFIDVCMPLNRLNYIEYHDFGDGSYRWNNGHGEISKTNSKIPL